MASIETLANFADIIGAALVIGGLLFAGIQIRLARVQREEAAAMSMFASYTQNPDVNLHAKTVMACDDIIEAAKDPVILAAINAIGVQIETFALVVKNRGVSLRLVAEWGGPGITRLWKKIQPLHEKEKRERGGTSPYDWWEWLATMIERHEPDTMTTSPMETYGDWVPK